MSEVKTLILSVFVIRCDSEWLYMVTPFHGSREWDRYVGVVTPVVRGPEVNGDEMSGVRWDVRQFKGHFEEVSSGLRPTKTILYEELLLRS